MPYGENVSKSRPDAYNLPYRVFKNGVEVPADALPMQCAARDGTEINGELLEFVRADGSAIEALVFAKPIRSDNGRIQGAVGICVDITARRQTEEALREANLQKDRFLAVLAHELRNPLAPIRGAVQLLQLLGSDVPDKGLAIEVIDRQVDMLSRLVDDLLDVSRISKERSRSARSRWKSRPRSSGPSIPPSRRFTREDKRSRSRFRTSRSMSRETQRGSSRSSAICSTMPPSLWIPAAGSR